MSSPKYVQNATRQQFREEEKKIADGNMADFGGMKNKLKVYLALADV